MEKRMEKAELNLNDGRVVAQAVQSEDGKVELLVYWQTAAGEKIYQYDGYLDKGE